VISRSEARTRLFVIAKEFVPTPGIRSFVIMESPAESGAGLFIVRGIGAAGNRGVYQVCSLARTRSSLIATRRSRVTM